MTITVLVRAGSGETRLTFDGTQRVVLGRGAGCDVRLPDPSVSLRHATLRAQGADFVLIDEGSSNGTFVGDVRVSPNTSRLVRSGERARLGRVWIELRIDQSPLTRDVASATRDLALAMVSDALAVSGEDPTLRVTVVEGRDQGASLGLDEVDRAYLVGRSPECDLALADPDASRTALEIVRRIAGVFVRDLGGRNGSWLGEQRLPGDREVVWRGAGVVRIGRTVLALREPVPFALATIEQAPDEPMVPGERLSTPAVTPPVEPAPVREPPPPSAPIAALPGAAAAPAARKKKSGWSGTDFAVMATAVTVLGLSVAALVWLLKP